MGIFKRLRDLTLASIHDALDQAEDPIKMLQQYLRDMEQDIRESEVSVAKQIAIEKRFKQQYDEAKQKIIQREEQAINALEMGNDDLARRVLLDKKNIQTRSDEMRLQYESAKDAADQLRSQLSEMKDQFNEMKTKKELLAARANAAKAQNQMHRAMTGFQSRHSAQGFDLMADQVLQLEAEAQTSAELLKRGQSLDDELKQLGDREIENELAALKAKLAEKKQQ